MNSMMMTQIARISTVCLMVFLVGSSFVGFAGEQASQKTEVKKEQTVGERININTANEQALDSLPQVGPAMARRIIEYREQNGPFKELKDLMNVKGIGEKTFEKLKDLITL